MNTKIEIKFPYIAQCDILMEHNLLKYATANGRSRDNFVYV